MFALPFCADTTINVHNVLTNTQHAIKWSAHNESVKKFIIIFNFLNVLKEFSIVMSCYSPTQCILHPPMDG